MAALPAKGKWGLFQLYLKGLLINSPSVWTTWKLRYSVERYQNWSEIVSILRFKWFYTLKPLRSCKLFSCTPLLPSALSCILPPSCQGLVQQLQDISTVTVAVASLEYEGSILPVTVRSSRPPLCCSSAGHTQVWMNGWLTDFCSTWEHAEEVLLSFEPVVLIWLATVRNQQSRSAVWSMVDNE